MVICQGIVREMSGNFEPAQMWQPCHDVGNPPPTRSGVPPPPPPRRIGQQMMDYLIRLGRYASCVHAGGLSC